MTIDISFILGIYNAERTLKECLDSIIKQDFPQSKYEVIIGDGGSTDSTLNIAKSYTKKIRNLTIFHNPGRLSEGKGMSKDTGVKKAKGRIVIFLDHDNILIGKNWLKEILKPFSNKEVMASQSLLQPNDNDTLFLQYVNALGVEDPFAVPYSLISQITLNPGKFRKAGRHYLFNLNHDNVLFIGANGCAFRKEVFRKIGGYTRDVDVSAMMAERNMVVAVPFKARVYHKTSNDFLSFIRKKGLYFFRFINKEYKTKSFNWNKVGSPPSSLRFFLMLLINLSIIIPLIQVFPKFIQTGKSYWLLHPFYLFYVTVLYGLIACFKIKNLAEYLTASFRRR